MSYTCSISPLRLSERNRYYPDHVLIDIYLFMIYGQYEYMILTS